MTATELLPYVKHAMERVADWTVATGSSDSADGAIRIELETLRQLIQLKEATR
jgi:hypothetical protein